MVDARDIPPNVVTINSTLKVRDLDSGEEMVFTVVSPSNADVSQGRISLLAPVGSAVVGYRAGDVWISTTHISGDQIRSRIGRKR